jgi:hypothetical protein
MFKLAFTSVLLLVFSAVSLAQKDKLEKIEGNGKLVTRDVAVSSFDALTANGVYELKLIQGAKESVKIEADENLHEYFTVRNEGSKLIIDTKKMDNKNLNIKNKIRVFVTFRTLKELDLSMVGSTNADDQLSFNDLKLNYSSVGNLDLKLSAKKIDVNNSSVGNLKLTGKADEAVVKHSGVGKVQAGEFVVQTMDIENTGVGGAEVNAQKDLKVKDSFLGKVNNRGSGTTRKMNKVRV